jgi:hypothetical protein
VGDEEDRMKITVEVAAKMAKMSVSAIRQKSAKMKLGRKEGGRKIFTLAEVKKLGGQKHAPGKGKKTKKPAAKKRTTAPKAAKPVAAARRAPAAKKAPVVKKAVVVVKKEEVKVQAKPPVVEKRPFWGFLGLGRKPKAKVSLMEVKGMMK